MVCHVCCHYRVFVVRPVAWSRPGAGRDSAFRIQLAHCSDVADAAAGTHCRRVRLRRAHHGCARHVADRSVRTHRCGDTRVAAPFRLAARCAVVDGIGHAWIGVAPAAAGHRRTAGRLAGGVDRHGHGQRGTAAVGEALLRRPRGPREHAVHHRTAGRHVVARPAGSAGGRRAGLAQLDGAVGAAGPTGVSGLGTGARQPPPYPRHRPGTGDAPPPKQKVASHGPCWGGAWRSPWA